MKLIPSFHGGVIFNPVLAADGTAAAPTYSFASDPDTGVYRSAANTIGFAAGGVQAGSWSNATLSVYSPAATNANLDLRAGGSLSFRFESQPASSGGNVFLGLIGGGGFFVRNAAGEAQFEVAPTASATERVSITGSNAGNPKVTASGNNLQFTDGTARATTATTGMIVIPATTGTPTGTPVGAGSGAIAMIYDTGADKIWFYNSGWRGVAVT